jgi:hypothetical protein
MAEKRSLAREVARGADGGQVRCFLSVVPNNPNTKGSGSGSGKGKGTAGKDMGRGLHSSTVSFWLNLSAFCGIQGAFRGIYEVSRGIRGCLGCILCQKRLRLS